MTQEEVNIDEFSIYNYCLNSNYGLKTDFTSLMTIMNQFMCNQNKENQMPKICQWNTNGLSTHKIEVELFKSLQIEVVLVSEIYLTSKKKLFDSFLSRFTE